MVVGSRQDSGIQRYLSSVVRNQIEIKMIVLTDTTTQHRVLVWIQCDVFHSDYNNNIINTIFICFYSSSILSLIVLAMRNIKAVRPAPVPSTDPTQ